MVRTIVVEKLPEHATDSLAHCPSCAAVRVGSYCPDCGERFLAAHDFDLWPFLVHELPHELFDVDGKVLRTVRYLFTRPGFLAAEYVSGRRVLYVNPIRLYIVAFLLHAFMASTLPQKDVTVPQRAEQIDPTGLVQHLIASHPGVDWDNPVVRQRQIQRGHWVAEGGTMLIFLGVAVAQQIVFHRSRRRYLEHAVLAMSACTFFVLLLTVIEIVVVATGATRFGSLDQFLEEGVGIIALVAYWFFAIRRFYGVSLPRALISTMVIAIVQIFLSIGLNIGALALLVWVS